jgi:3-vinyl bacteriochlorophyllide hydratase
MPLGKLYTAEERRRRDASGWTLVQGVLAPLQFIVFLVSLALVLRFLATGEGLGAATVSVVIKTFVLYTIMVTGSIWEKEVFGVYLFARPFSGRTFSAWPSSRCIPRTWQRSSRAR